MTSARLDVAEVVDDGLDLSMFVYEEVDREPGNPRVGPVRHDRNLLSDASAAGGLGAGLPQVGCGRGDGPGTDPCTPASQPARAPTGRLRKTEGVDRRAAVVLRRDARMPRRVFVGAALICAGSLVMGCGTDEMPDPPSYDSVVPWQPHPVAAIDPSGQSGVPDQADAQKSLMVEILGSSRPRRIEPGDLVRFTVRLTNPTNDPIPLHPCPVYRMAIDGQGEPMDEWHRLHCEAASEIGPHRHVDFAMQKASPDGCCSILWFLWGYPGPYDGDVLGACRPEEQDEFGCPPGG